MNESADGNGTHATASAERRINAFTVDVEDYYHVAALAPAIPRESWDQHESRVEANTERLLALLAEHGVRGTFFVLGWVAERSPGLVRRIAEAGHEIACHGFSPQLVYRQSPEEFRDETTRAKGCLEDIIGQAVQGYRAASFSVTRASLWALDVLIDLGFRYDSSIFPIRHDRYGLPGATPEPNRLRAPSGRTLVEFPMEGARLVVLRAGARLGWWLFPHPAVLADARGPQADRAEWPPFHFLSAPLGGGSRTAAHPGGRVLPLPPLHQSRALREPAAARAGGFPLHLDA